jgi:hypothetical protein
MLSEGRANFMSIGRNVLGVVLFVAVILGMRWGGNALLEHVVKEAQNPSKSWWGSGPNPVTASPLQGADFKVQPIDMQKFNQGFLYQPPGGQNQPGRTRQ